MTPGLALYRAASSLVHPFASLAVDHRIRAGKDARSQRHERLAKTLPPRPDGPLIWFHGASIGETQMLMALRSRLRANGLNFSALFTVQTQTGYTLLRARADPTDIITLAPADTPVIAQRFMRHWKPDMALFGEGEIWPNLLQAAADNGAKLGLLNARLTAGSLDRWATWPRSARHVFSLFDLILASDTTTSDGLSHFLDRPLEPVGNLKMAISAANCDNTDAPPATDPSFPTTRTTLLLASSHPGEEAMVLSALTTLSSPPFLIIAPRHPARSDEIGRILDRAGLAYVRRSSQSPLMPQHDVLLADTIGEMALWYRAADLVYLGGGHATGIGGHNPMEAARLRKPIISGPDTFNFSSLMAKLTELNIVHTANDETDLRMLLRGPLPPPDQAGFASFLEAADEPMTRTVQAVAKLWRERGAA